MKAVNQIQFIFLLSLTFNINAQVNDLKTLKGKKINLTKNDYVKIYQANNTNGTATCYNYLYGKLVGESEHELKVELLESAFVDCLMKNPIVFEDDFRLEKRSPIVNIPKNQIFELVQMNKSGRKKLKKAKRFAGFGLIAAAILAIPLKVKSGPLKYGLAAGSGISGSMLLASSMDQRMQTNHPWNHPDYFKVPQEINRNKNIKVTP